MKHLPRVFHLTYVICRRVLTVNEYSLTVKEWSFVSNATNNFLSSASSLSPKWFFLSVCNFRPRRGRGWQTCDLRLSFLLAMVCILFFYSTVPESGNFVSRSGREVGAFRTEGRKSLFRTCTIFTITKLPLGRSNISASFMWIEANHSYCWALQSLILKVFEDSLGWVNISFLDPLANVFAVAAFMKALPNK